MVAQLIYITSADTNLALLVDNTGDGGEQGEEFEGSGERERGMVEIPRSGDFVGDCCMEFFNSHHFIRFILCVLAAAV